MIRLGYKFFRICFAVLIFFAGTLQAQQKYQATQKLESIHIGTSESLLKISKENRKSAPNGKTAKLGIHKKKNWPQQKNNNPNALPNGIDPALQNGNSNVTAINETTAFDGQDFTGVDPADPSVGMSQTHIIQMVNSAIGSLIEIYDRNGDLLAGPVTLDNITNIQGLGDPIVLYDQFADRWILSEIIAGQNGIAYAVSTTADPLGTWNIFSLITPKFPDYQKWSLWSDFYLITVHENPNTAYAIERSEVLAGNSGAGVLQFTFPVVNTITFHSVAPVHLTGFTPPPSGDPAWAVRVMDDGWDASIASDHIELWAIGVDWNTISNSFLAGPIPINTTAFDTDLCGFNNYSCVPQPGTAIKLDPIKEMFMHQVQYRNFGTHESMVMSHTIDVDGNDRVGIRWYELRSVSGSPWSIHQESTFSPDNEGRFMPSLSINADGDMLLAYNKSGNNTFPSLYATGRLAGDPINTMTSDETVIKAGTAANNTNRYGDYNHTVIDPIDDRMFCFTGMYNSSQNWSTRISCLNLSQAVLAAEDLNLLGTHQSGYNTLKSDLSEFDNTDRIEIYKGESTDLERIATFSSEQLNLPNFKFDDYDIITAPLWYYQIKHVDQNGTEIFSDIVAIENKSANKTKADILPNPFEEILVIKLSAQQNQIPFVLKISDLMGRTVTSQLLDMNQNVHKIATHSYPKGIYLVNIYQNGILVQSNKMVKS